MRAFQKKLDDMVSSFLPMFMSVKDAGKTALVPDTTAPPSKLANKVPLTPLC
jgi:hypothetical protein